MTVKEIVAAVSVGQSTVSAHLRQLAAVGFVLAEDHGTSRLYRINQACVGLSSPPPPTWSWAAPRRSRTGWLADVRIEPMTERHAAAVLAIYQAGIDEGDATFETQAPAWPEFDRARLPDHRFVASNGTDVLGWVAVFPVSGRCVYAGVVEHSVYVHPAAHGRESAVRSCHALIEVRPSRPASGPCSPGVFPENTASLRLHERDRVRVVGTRERVGRPSGSWRNIILIERRSPLI